MDEKIIPTIVLLLNFISMIGLVVFQFLAGFSSFLMIAAWLSLVLVAYWVYENDKRIEFMEEHIWKRNEELEESVKLNRICIEDMKERLKRLEEQQKEANQNSVK
jgi:biopolymer transport protein ExbB/TolQ